MTALGDFDDELPELRELVFRLSLVDPTDHDEVRKLMEDAKALRRRYLSNAGDVP